MGDRKIKRNKQRTLLYGIILIIHLFIPSSARAETLFDEIIGPAKQIAPALKQEEALEEKNFYRHRDNYFLAGQPISKVQLSFKLRPVLNFNLYFAYTQIMFWKVTANSRPFNDITFNPEIFYEWLRPESFVRGVKLGFEHKSNGKSAMESRSLDQVFTELETHFGWQGLQILWDTRLFWIYDIDWQTNADIKGYTSFWYTRFTVDGLFEKLIPSKAELYIQLHPGGAYGTEIRYGAIEAGLKVRMRLFHVMPYLMLQFYDGYLESMLFYNKPTQSYRIGFVL